MTDRRFPRSLERLHREEAGYAVRHIIQIALGMTLLGLALYDGGQLVKAQIRAESVARAAAVAGADIWYRTGKLNLARDEAVAAAARLDPTAIVTSVDVAADRKTVSVRVEKPAGTIVVHRVGFLERFATQVATDSETGPQPS